MNHLELANVESASALDVHPYERWADACERELGHSLDGDQGANGYSMDHSYDCWKAGTTAAAYAASVKSQPNYRPRVD